jgi:hypothetical protein
MLDRMSLKGVVRACSQSSASVEAACGVHVNWVGREYAYGDKRAILCCGKWKSELRTPKPVLSGE